jgi:hypothetical protein
MRGLFENNRNIFVEEVEIEDKHHIPQFSANTPNRQ